MREVVCDYIGRHDSEEVKCALAYFSNEFNVRHIEKRFAKILKHDDAFPS